MNMPFVDYVYNEHVEASEVHIKMSHDEDSGYSKTEVDSLHERPRSLNAKARTIAGESFVIFFDNETKCLRRFNPRNQTVTTMQEYDKKMKGNGFTSVSIGDYIYVLMEPEMYRLEYLDTEAKWERMPDLIGGHGGVPHAITASGTIIVAGASNGKHTKSVTKYDPSLNLWKKLKDKRLSTNYSANVASDGYVYCIGGIIEGSVSTDKVERFNVVRQTWDEAALMNEARYWASAVECGENLFVAGGWTRSNRYMTSPQEHLNSVEKYDPTVDQWTVMKPMNVKRFGHSFQCHLIQGSIYAVGEARNGVEKYDFDKDEWEKVQLRDAIELIIAGSVVVEMME